MEQKMRRKDRQLPEEEAWSLLRQGDHGVLSVIGDDGWPYGVPINYIVWNRKLYLHCAKQGYKLDAIGRDSRVCFTVVTKSDLVREHITTAYESVIVFGNAVVVTEERERAQALEHLLNDLSSVSAEDGQRYLQKMLPVTAVIRVDPAQITAKANRKFAPLSQRLGK